MEGNKNNVASIIIVAILIAVVCLLIGFIIGRELLPKEETKTTETGENKNNNENSSDEIVTISKDEYNVVVQEAANKIQIYNEYFGQKYSSTGINATNDEFLVFLVANVKKSNFTVDDLKETAKLYFNTNVNYTDIKVPGSNIVLYKLDSNGKYINQNAPTDGPATLAMHSFYEGATYNKTKDSYTLNMKNIYNQVCGGTCGIGYGSFYSDSTLSTKIYTNDTDDKMSFADVYDKVKDELPITSYTFEKNSSGNYVLTSVVIK